MNNSSGPTDENQEEELIQGGKVMGLMEHLGELRTRLFYAFGSLLVVFAVMILFAKPVMEFLQRPLLIALPDLTSGSKALNFTGPLDVFLTTIKVGFLGAVVAGCPFWLYQFWKFVEPALYPSERKYILPFVVASIAMFYAGVAFSFYVILPLALTYLIGLGLEIGNALITVTDYFSLLIMLMFAFGLIFETPLILILLALLDLLDAKTLKANRGLVLVIILVAGALLTPPDPMSQVGLALPVYIMYEMSIVIIGIIKRKPKDLKNASK